MRETKQVVIPFSQGYRKLAWSSLQTQNHDFG